MKLPWSKGVETVTDGNPSSRPKAVKTSEWDRTDLSGTRRNVREVIQYWLLAGSASALQSWRTDSFFELGKQVSTDMRIARSLVAGALIAGAASVFAMLGAGSAGAVEMAPTQGGVRVDLSPGDTQWVSENGFGNTLAALPHPSAASFGQALDGAAKVSSEHPTGRVVFTVYGPMDELNGTMLAVK